MKINEVLLNEGPYDRYNFRSIFLCGAPGSGKTTIEHLLGLQTLGLKSLNVDKTIMYLQSLNHSYPQAGQTTEKRLNLYADNYLGLIANATGRNADSIIRLNKKLKENYYNTFMLFIEVDKNIAQQRIKSRPVTSNNPEDINRKVDLDYFEEAYENTSKNIDLYKLLFGNTFALVHNNNEDIDINELNSARKKINKFLLTPPSIEAQAIMKGVKSKPASGIGRNYIRPNSQRRN